MRISSESIAARGVDQAPAPGGSDERLRECRRRHDKVVPADDSQGAHRASV